MGLFGKKKDWNVIAVLFESKGKYSVNGTRAKGATADAVKKGVAGHDRTVYWAVFDQKRAVLEGHPGNGAGSAEAAHLQRLIRDLQKLPTIRDVLTELESGKTEKIAKVLEWGDA